MGSIRGLAVLLGVCAVSGPARAQLVWTEVATLSGRNPALAPAPNGGVHVVVADGNLRHVELDAGGTALLDEVIPDTDGAASGYSFGPALAVGAGTIQVAFARELGTWMLSGHHVMKTAAGWTPVLELQPSTERGYAPSIAVDESGVAHVLIGAATNVPFGVANYYRVSAGSVTQAHAALIEWRADDKTAIVTGPGGAVHAFGGYPSPSGHVALASSTSGGSTFAAQVELQPPDVGAQRVGQPHAVVDGSGTVHVVLGAGDGSSGSCACAVHYAAITAGSVAQISTVTPPGVLVPWHLSLGIARIGLLASGKRVVAWQQHSGDDAAAPVSSSVSDDGQSWSPPQNAIDDCGGAEGRNTIDLVASGDAVWLACPKGSSVRLFRATEGGSVPCNPESPFAGVGVTPSNGSGPAQAFVTQISHCEGASAFRIVQLRVTRVVDAQEPAVAPSFEAGLFHLDAESCAPGEAKQLASTHGTLDCASSTVAQNGNQMLVTFALGFDTDSFSGERGLFVDAKGGSTTPEPRLGWTEVGSFTVEPGVPGSGGSSGAAPTDRGGVTEDSSGCGCRVPRRTGSPAIAVVLGLLAALLRRRQARG